MIGLLCEIVIFFFYINVHDCMFIKLYIMVPIDVASEEKGWDK